MDDRTDIRLQRLMGWLAVGLVTMLSIAYFGIIMERGIHDKAWLKIAQDQFAAVLGLPAAAVGSLFLVLVLRMASGPIEVEIGPLKFKGAAAPIVFWLICFLGMALSIKMLWVK